MDILNLIIAFLLGAFLGILLNRRNKKVDDKELANSPLYHIAKNTKSNPVILFFNKTNDLEIIPIKPEDLEYGLFEKDGKAYSLSGDNISIVYRKEDGLVLRQPGWFLVEADVHPQTVQSINSHYFFSLSGESLKKYDELMTQQQFLLSKLKNTQDERERKKLLEKIAGLQEELDKIMIEEKPDKVMYLGENPNITKKVAANKQGLPIDEEIEEILNNLDLE